MLDDDRATVSPQNGHVRELDVRQKIEAEEALAEVLYSYAGKWVAVEDHVVIDDSSDLGILVGRLNGQRATAEVFKVQADPSAACA